MVTKIETAFTPKDVDAKMRSPKDANGKMRSEAYMVAQKTQTRDHWNADSTH